MKVTLPEININLGTLITWGFIIVLIIFCVKTHVEIQVINAFKQINANQQNIQAVVQVLQQEGIIKPTPQQAKKPPIEEKK